MVWRNTTKWVLDLKHQQQDTIIFGLVARANEESCKWNTCKWGPYCTMRRRRAFFFFFFYEWEYRTGTMCPFSSLHPLKKGMQEYARDRSADKCKDRDCAADVEAHKLERVEDGSGLQTGDGTRTERQTGPMDG